MVPVSNCKAKTTSPLTSEGHALVVASVASVSSVAAPALALARPAAPSAPLARSAPARPLQPRLRGARKPDRLLRSSPARAGIA